MLLIKYKRKEDKIGEIKINKQGTPMKLIAYRNVLDCDVEFQDEYKFIFKHAIYQNFLKGQIKNPYDKTVFGIGMLGTGRHTARIGKEHNRAYTTWADVIRRCYVNEEMFPAYFEKSTMCGEWIIFQNFGDWYEANWYPLPNNERLHLDKDILVEGNKHYSPCTCLLVPQKINMLFSNKERLKNDGLPNGLQKSNNGSYRASYNKKCLGTFNTLVEAYDAYASEKEKAIKQRAEKYKEIIPEKLYNALLNYKVRLEFDKNYESWKGEY